ncbi:hypothetical protein NMG60_11022470 [Bertholletia excelsa]
METQADELQHPLLQPRTLATSSASFELEKLLSDLHLPPFKRLRLAILMELKVLIPLAGPAVVVYLIDYFMVLTTRIFAGNCELAVTSLGNDGKQTFAYGLMLGMSSATATLCSQAYGARKHQRLGVYLQKSTVVLTLTALLLTVISLLSEAILILLLKSTAVASSTAFFVYGLIPQIFAYAFHFPVQKFLQSQNNVGPTAWISAATLAVHLTLSWTVVCQFGLGLTSLSLVLSLSSWIMVSAQYTYLAKCDECQATWTGVKLEAFCGLLEFTKLSVASAAMTCLETWYPQILVLLAGLLDNDEIALDAISVCLTLNGLFLMVSIGFNATASIRIGNELGAGNPKSAAFSVVVVSLVSFGIAVVEAASMLVFRHVICFAFTGGEIVADAVSNLCPLLAVSLILNGVQQVLSGVAVGCGWQESVAFVNLGCHYLVGIPLGCLLGFKFNLGVKGLWSGMLGGTLMQIVILIWYTYWMDWNKEVEKARKYLGIWDGNDAKRRLLKLLSS